MSGSWQLQFLLSQEEQAHSLAIEDYDAQILHVQHQWAKLTSTLVDLEIHVPVLHQYDKDATVMRLRASFLALEGIGKDKDMKEAHRQLIAAEAESTRERLSTLPPVPPPRNSKPKSTRNLATGVRALPARPPSAAEADSTPKRGVTLPPPVRSPRV